MSRIEILDKTLRSPVGAEQWLLRDTESGQHYIASGVNAMFSGWEVLVFEAKPDGEVTDWGEVVGGRGISHEEAIADLEDVLQGEATPA